MQKLLALVLAVSVLPGVCALAQSKAETGHASHDKSAPATKVSNLTGRIKSEKGKITFISRPDRRSWEVLNPEAVKGHEGQLIAIKANVYPDKNTIRVVEILKGTSPYNAHVSKNAPDKTE
jgi:hypothetical protein